MTLPTCKVHLGESETCPETAVIHGYCYEHYRLHNFIVSYGKRNKMQDAVNADMLERLTRLEEVARRILDMIEAINERYR
jgi:hypothetical protein